MVTWLVEDDEVLVHTHAPYHLINVCHSSRHGRINFHFYR